MVKNRIRIYARLKKETKPYEPVSYSVSRHGKEDVLTIFNNDSPKCNQYKYRFDKIFDTTSKQTELFDSIAKPIINGVLNGFNGTIFAYGPTGSGKTYSLTGSHTRYNNRGLIPRSIEYIFNFITKSFDNYVINISYLEIYNEIAYDLLNSKENVSTLEEMPRVLLLEDNKGEAHYKNLSVPRVCSEEEAMRLLFLGDTNRTIAETPLNEYSSRSHCIFTLHVTARVQQTGKIIKSKLNLVDLAGSERVHKMNLNGITLCEAKYINLSLHYLEQVITAISETKRMHIPFRNSIMTLMLRDSISGNCLTAMLATIAVTKFNFEETIATCKFSQRVSLVKTDVRINEETDPYTEIEMLRSEICRLRQLLEGKEDKNDKLEMAEEAECRSLITNYLYNNHGQELSLSDLRKARFYIDFMRREVKKLSSDKSTGSKSLTAIEQKYKAIIKQKEDEISILKNIYNNKLQENEPKTPITSNHQAFEITEMEKAAYEKFLRKSEHKSNLDFYKNTLEEKHTLATDIAKVIGDEKKKITDILASIEANRGNFEHLQQLSYKLKSEQNVYRELLLKLQNIKSEIDYLKNGARRFEVKLIGDFKKWCSLNTGGDCAGRNSQVVDEKSASEPSILARNCRYSARKAKSEKFDIRAKLDELLDDNHDDTTEALLPEKDLSGNFDQKASLVICSSKSSKQKEVFMSGDDYLVQNESEFEWNSGQFKRYTDIKKRIENLNNEKGEDYEVVKINDDFIQSNNSEDFIQNFKNEDFIRSNKNQDYIQSNKSEDFIRSNKNQDYIQSNKSEDFIPNNKNGEFIQCNKYYNLIQSNKNQDFIQNNKGEEFNLKSCKFLNENVKRKLGQFNKNEFYNNRISEKSDDEDKFSNMNISLGVKKNTRKFIPDKYQDLQNEQKFGNEFKILEPCNQTFNQMQYKVNYLIQESLNLDKHLLFRNDAFLNASNTNLQMEAFTNTNLQIPSASSTNVHNFKPSNSSDLMFFDAPSKIDLVENSSNSNELIYSTSSQLENYSNETASADFQNPKKLNSFTGNDAKFTNSVNDTKLQFVDSDSKSHLTNSLSESQFTYCVNDMKSQRSLIYKSPRAEAGVSSSKTSSNMKISVSDDDKPVRENGLYRPDDSRDFLDFMKTIPLTGDKDVDEEIVKFYRMKFNN